MNQDVLKSAIEAYEQSLKKWDPALEQKVSRAWDELFANHMEHFGVKGLGYVVGPGWWQLLHQALTDIEAVMAQHQPLRFKVRQIKEKFGGLRFYWMLVDGDNQIPQMDLSQLYEQLQSIVQTAEERAGATCEACGEPGGLETAGWMKTLCDKHARVHREEAAKRFK